MSASPTGYNARAYRLNRVISLAAGLFLLLALVSGAGNLSLYTKLTAAQGQIDALAKSAAQSAKEAAKDSADAARAVHRATVAERERDAARAAVVAREVVRREIHDSAVAAVAAAPDTCDTVIAALQADVEAANKDVTTYLGLWDREVVAHNGTKQSLIRAQLGLAEAARNLAALSSAAKAIEIPRPSLLSRILPQASAGCTAGLSILSARPDAVCGASLGWRISL